MINNKSITLPEQTLRQLHHSTMTPIQQAALDAANSKNKDDFTVKLALAHKHIRMHTLCAFYTHQV